MRLRAYAVAGLTAGALLAGCSSSGPGSTADAKAVLRSDVLALSRAAAAHKWTAANAALGQLRSDLSLAQAAGRIDAADVRTLRTHISAVAADLAAQTAPAPTSAPPPSSAPPPPATHKPAPPPKSPKAPARKHHHGHGNGGGDGGGGD